MNITGGFIFGLNLIKEPYRTLVNGGLNYKDPKVAKFLGR